jgi:DNA-nicking Smr family endonuclease
VVTSEEAKLWRDSMRGTKILSQKLTVEEPLAAPAKANQIRPPETIATAVPASPHPRPVPAVSPVPMLDHRRAPGVDKSTAGRFAKGMMEIDATIDLHGLTQPVAHAALSRFIVGSAEMGRRCLLVITGKGNREGSGILRSEVPRWLSEPDLRGRILTYSHAQPKHGGQGALYVLLKRRR